MGFNPQQIVITNDDLHELNLEVVVGLSESRVHGEVQLKSVGVLIADSNVAVGDDSRAHLVCHCPGCVVADPGVNTSTTREHPEKVRKVKVFNKGVRDDDHGNFEVGEAAFADVGPLAARANIIVIIHIDIEDHFFLHGHERFFVARVVTIWRNVVHCSNVNFVRHSINQRLFELLSIFEAQVATVNIVGQSERKLSLVEVSGMGAIIETRKGLVVPLHHLPVTNPFEHQLVGEDALVVDLEPVLVELELDSTA